MSTPTKYCTIPNLDLDCPAIHCTGWLIGYKLRSDTSANSLPLFFRCSDNLCEQKVMISKFGSRCVICNQPIRQLEIITRSAEGGPWVHCACYGQPTDFFATCQRCKEHISSEEDYVQTTCSGKPGYCHRACATKKRLASPDDSKRPLYNLDNHDDDDDDGDDFNGSQDSLDSRSSLSSPTKKPASNKRTKA